MTQRLSVSEFLVASSAVLQKEFDSIQTLVDFIQETEKVENGVAYFIHDLAKKSNLTESQLSLYFVEIESTVGRGVFVERTSKKGILGVVGLCDYSEKYYPVTSFLAKFALAK
jgi:hypothetical protein